MQQGSSVIGRVDPGKSKDGTDSKTQQQNQLQKAQHQEKKDLQQLMQVINQYVEEHNLQSQVSATNTQRGIAVTLNDLFLFDLGKADLKPGALEILDKLASLLPTLNAKISIEGHTDNLPLATGSIYKDNWGLSQARSLSVLRYFLYNARLDPSKMISTAYADTMPVADNTTEANRAKKPACGDCCPPRPAACQAIEQIQNAYISGSMAE